MSKNISRKNTDYIIIYKILLFKKAHAFGSLTELFPIMWKLRNLAISNNQNLIYIFLWQLIISKINEKFGR